MVNIGDGSTVVLVTSLIPSHFSMCCFQIIDDFCSLPWTQTLSLKTFLRIQSFLRQMSA